ncbi:hypothetical protein HDU80_005508 [Chytriomyces hyalinus]|nr:hypothetical protein HDU80_005508 [Chytriomyces hyalinus]
MIASLWRIVYGVETFAFDVVDPEDSSRLIVTIDELVASKLKDEIRKVLELTQDFALTATEKGVKYNIKSNATLVELYYAANFIGNRLCVEIAFKSPANASITYPVGDAAVVVLPQAELPLLSVATPKISLPKVDKVIARPDQYDGFLSYKWDKQDIAKLVYHDLKAKNLNIWFDLAHMSGETSEAMAEGVEASLVFIPLLSMTYQESENCMLEIRYAKDRKKKMVPIRILDKNEEDAAVGTAFAITAGLLYTNLADKKYGSIEWNMEIDLLEREILNKRAYALAEMKKSSEKRRMSTNASDLMAWLNPVDVTSDMATHHDAYVPNTRLWALENLHAWLQDPKADNVLWLNGGAGVGKSVIAWLISQNLPIGFSLGSIFFCRHDDMDKNSAKQIVRTMIYTLSSKFPAFKAYAEEVQAADLKGILAGKPSVLKSASLAFTNIVVNGLKKLNPVRNPKILLVIDALDECGKMGDPDRTAILNILRGQAKSLPSFARIFVTGRPDIDIYETMASLKSDMLLPTSKENLADIEIFVQHQLRRHFPKLIANDPELLSECAHRILEKSEGFFIYARVVVDQLEKVSAANLLLEVSEFQSGLDSVYLHVLKRSHVKREDFRLVVGVILGLQELMTLDSLAFILNVDVSFVGNVVSKIRSVLTIDPATDTIAVIHKSFADFLVDPRRCVDTSWFINMDDINEIIVQRSLEIMNGSLRRDIAGITQARITEKIEPADYNFVFSPELSYACRFWTRHLTKTNVDAVFSQLHEFSTTHLSHWIEALVLLEAFNEMKPNVHQILPVLDFATDPLREVVDNLFNDALALCDAQSVPFVYNPLHVYQSGLPFIPYKTELSKAYKSDTVPQVVLGLNERWVERHSWIPREELKSAPFSGHWDNINCLAISPDKKYLASAASDTTVKIWLLETYELVMTLEGHASHIWFVDFSANGAMLASGSFDHEIRIWSMEEETFGECVTILTGHLDGISECTFSADSKFIVSTSWDRTIRVWDVEAASLATTVSTGHMDGINTVRFSPDSTRFATGSWDQTVRIWSLEFGVVKPVATIDGYDASIFMVRWSPDGSLLASATMDGFVKIWTDLDQEPKLFAALKHDATVLSICFSPDGRKLAAAAGKNAYIWNLDAGGELCYKVEGHLESINSVIFHKDASMLLTSSADKSIKVWNLGEEGAELVQSIDGHHFGMRPLCISPDGNFVASATSSNVFKLWSLTEPGTCLAEIDAHEQNVSSLCFSPDSSLVASASYDCTVKICNVIGADVVATLDGHFGFATALDFSPDGAILATGAGDGTVRICETQSFTVVHSFAANSKGVYSLKFANEGSILEVTDTDKKVTLWSVGDWTPVDEVIAAEAPADNSNKLVFNPRSGWIDKGDQKCVWLPAEYRSQFARDQVSQGPVIAVNTLLGEKVFVVRMTDAVMKV